ncbi:MAG: hypothetical protein ACT4O0_10815 [Pseudonocardia sp.]
MTGTASQDFVLRPEEQVLGTWTVETMVKSRQGGFILKITVWEEDGVRWNMHLTNQRLIMQPLDPSRARHVIERGVVAAAALIFDPSGATHAASQGISRRKAANSMVAGRPIIVELDQVVGAEVFSWVRRQMLRILVTGLDADGLVVSVVGTPASRETVSGMAARINTARPAVCEDW